MTAVCMHKNECACDYIARIMTFSYLVNLGWLLRLCNEVLGRKSFCRKGDNELLKQSMNKIVICHKVALILFLNFDLQYREKTNRGTITRGG